MAQEDRTTGLVGYSGVKVPVRAATTANITLNGLQTIDGVVLAQDDRVLVKNQTTGANNGVYLADTGDWNRAPDFDGPYDIVKGSIILITDGTTLAGQTWKVATDNPITIGTTSLSFTRALYADASGIGFTQFGTGASSRTVQERLRDTINVKDFGAVGDGTTDDTAAFQAAINAATYGAVAGAGSYPAGNHFGRCAALYIPSSANPYVISNLNIYAPMSLVGDNPRGSRLIGKSGATGYMINIDGFNASASLTDSYGLPHIRIENVGFEGNNRQANYGCLYLSSLAYFSLRSLNIELFSKEAMNFYTSCLEGSVSKINMRYCGDVSSGYPEVNLFDQHAVASERDAHNMITFEDIWSIFPFGHHFYLDTLAGRAFLTRDITFDRIYCHAVVSGGIAGQPTPTVAQESGCAFVIKSATTTMISNTRVPLQGTAVATIHQLAGSHATNPSGTIINGLVTSGRPDTTANRYGVRVEVGDLSIDNASMSSCQEGSIVATAGANVRIGSNVMLADPTVLPAGTQAINNVSFPRIDQKVQPADAATIAIDASKGNFFSCGMGSTTRTIGSPTNPTDGQTITLELGGVGGGVPTTPTFQSAYKLTGGVFQIGSSLIRTISFKYDAGLVLWEEIGRSVNQDGGITTLTDAATIAVDGVASSTYVVTLGGNRTLGNPTNRTPGKRYEFMIIQDGTGGRTLAFDTAYKHAWADTGNTANKRQTVVFVDDATCIYMTQVGAISGYLT